MDILKKESVKKKNYVELRKAMKIKCEKFNFVFRNLYSIHNNNHFMCIELWLILYIIEFDVWPTIYCEFSQLLRVFRVFSRIYR